ncbi:ABC transporter ATP-binding protein/permease [Treponema sp. OttesenSCG-928-L16]|nr:ABC transporter ATP-binding protein/permease [Treponema sp. OttesenSCG-928-L16]
MAQPRVSGGPMGGRGVPYAGTGIKSRDAGKVIARLLSYLGMSRRILLGLVLFCILISSAAGVAGSLFLRLLIDDYIVPLLGTAHPVFSGLLRAIFIMAGIYLAGIAANLFYNRIMAVITQGIQKQIRDEMFSKMQRLPVGYFDTHNFGGTMSRYTNDIDTLRQMLSQSIPMLFSGGLTIFFVFASMLYTSLLLTGLIVIMIAAMLFVSRSVSRKSGRYFIKQQSDIAAVNGYVEEMINGQKVVKVFNHEDTAKEEFFRLNQKLEESAHKANSYANILGPINAQMGNLNYVLIAIIGGVFAVSGIGGLSLGAIASFLQLSRSISMPINQVTQQLNSVVMALAGAERIFDLMDEKPEQDSGYVTLVNAKYDETGNLMESDEPTDLWAWKHPHGDGSVTYTKLAGEVEFFNVDFSYDGRKTVLHDVSIDASPGKKLAFVGATGAGKTTITNLINRFYDIADGKIRYDGININKIKKDDLRRSLGMILQDVNLFTGTVKDNIRYGNLDATDEEIEAAAKLAGAHDFISRLPDGYDTEISGDGSGLSQGQRQLISIARAAAANPPVMIMDEATSSIDTRTEAIVQQGMDSLMRGRTVFVIAHRLSTVQNADEIIVLDHGRIIEQGNHEQLIRKHGRYYQLYTGDLELE